MKRNKKHLGFTLLEILIALFIFSIVAAVVTRGLHTVLISEEASEKKSRIFSHLQLTMVFFTQDFEQVINRPINNAKNMIESGFLGTGTEVAFTHGGLANPLWQLDRGTLQRTRYRVEKGILWRDTWAVLDQDSRSMPESRALLKNVTELHFQYLDKDSHFQDRWPMTNDASNIDLPRAIQISFTLKNHGTVKRLFIISGKKFEKPH